MASFRSVFQFLRLAVAALAVALTLAPLNLGAQQTEEMVVGVDVTGNVNVDRRKILAMIRTRAGKRFDMTTIQADARALSRSGQFIDVRPRRRVVKGGVVVVFEVVERPLLRYVKYLGNKKINDKKLAKETGLKTGDPLSPHAVEEGRRKIETYYGERGYNDAEVEIVEGSRPTDAGAVYLISEGKSQRIRWTHFVGNTIASDARLRTQIQSKPGILWIFKGKVNRKKIEEDVDRITAYYRSLGYFRAKVSRELRFDSSQSWLTLTFYISEGPRYVVRDVSFVGNRKLATSTLSTDLKLKKGDFFDQKKLAHDLSAIRDVYGSQGYIFADVNADPRFLEGPEGQLDLVYNIAEHNRFRVRRINVRIEGDNPHTRRNVVLNRISVRPGDIVDVRELRLSQIRLQRSGLFKNEPHRGIEPKISFSRPDDIDGASGIASEPRGGGNFRGQSPDGDEWIDVNVRVSTAPPRPQPRHNETTRDPNSRQNWRPPARRGY